MSVDENVKPLIQCVRCGKVDPRHFTVSTDGSIFGCDDCPDAHRWLGAECELCGAKGMDESTTNVCPRRSQ